MAFGARGSARDFGLSGGLTLPVLNQREHYATSGQAFMPQEKSGRRKGFAVEQENVASSRKRMSIADRIKNWFKKKHKEPEQPRSQNNTLSRPPKLDTIPEQSEDDDDNKENVHGSVDHNQGAGNGGNVGNNEVVMRDQRKPPDRTPKAYSTAFEHTVSSSQETLIEKVHLTFQTAAAGPKKVVLQRSPEHDSFGFHLSGGQPPITIMYVKPGSLADREGIKAGDVLLDLNGINCRRRVEMSQLIKMKTMFQQPEQFSTGEQSPGRPVGIVKTKVTVTDVQKGEARYNNNQDDEIGDPLATSSPIKPNPPTTEAPVSKEQTPGGKSNGGSKKVKKKKSEKPKKAKTTDDLPLAPHLSNEDQFQPEEVQKIKSKKKKAKQDSSSATPVEEELQGSGEQKKNGKKKKKRSSAIEDQAEDRSARESESYPPEASLSVDVDPTPSPAAADDKEKSVPEEQGKDGAEVDEEELNLQRKDRNRRSKSPKSRYRKNESEIVADGEEDVQQKDPKKKKKATKTTSGEESGKDKKKKKKTDKGTTEDDKEQKSDKNATGGDKKKSDKSATEDDKKKKSSGLDEDQEKKKRKKSTPTRKSSKKASRENPQEKTVKESAEEEQPEMPILSAAVSGSFESDTMEFVPRHRQSKSELQDKKEVQDAEETKSSPKKGKKKKKKENEPSTHSLKRDKKKDKSASQSSSGISMRRASVDQGELSSDKHRHMNNSQSFSSIEEQRRFREELKEASKSEHNIASMDPNIKVKKSGLVKSKSTSSSRPSIFNQSSSPEPEMTSMSSLTASEKEGEFQPGAEDLPDPDFKVKKSGVVMGRKTSSGTRPSILDEQSSDAFSDIQPGEMRYNKDVEMDLNSVPQIAPSLGLVAGRDRRDAINRSLTKRRPPSIRQTSQDKDESTESYPSDTVSKMAAAKKMFENPADKQEPTSRYNGRSFSKSVEKPPKALTISSESAKDATPTKVEDKPAPRPANAWSSNRATKMPSAVEEKENTPSWVSKAQDVHKRASTLERSSQPPKPTTSNTPSSKEPTHNPSSKDGIPSMGHVAARLAMFQKH